MHTLQTRLSPNPTVCSRVNASTEYLFMRPDVIMVVIDVDVDVDVFIRVHGHSPRPILDI